jgi:peptidoglycan-associated lipoprotein
MSAGLREVIPNPLGEKTDFLTNVQPEGKNMKTTLIYSCALALAVTLTATGCRHKPGHVTPLPAGMTQPPAESTLPTLPPGPAINNSGENPNANGIPLPDSSLINGMIPDRAALAAYTIHFAFDSAVIRSSEQGSLQSVASALAADPNTKLLVEGNCDERGTEEYNRALGERRALAAREALVKLNVDPMRVFTRSYGKDKPSDPGHDESAWQKNRRDDFVLLHPKP